MTRPQSFSLTERHDLVGGAPAWRIDADTERAADPLPVTADVVVVGAGIMGAIVGEAIAASGRHVTFIDRHPPATSSTAASTAQVMWGMDMPMSELAERIGEQAAADRWRQVFASVRALADRIDRLAIPCAKAEIPTLYLDGDKLDAKGLRAEAALQAKHGLPAEYLDAEAVADRFAIAPRPGIVSTGGFEVNPVALALGMVDAVRDRGGTLCFPHDVQSVAPAADRAGIVLTLADGREVRARDVVLATGYERPLLFLPPAFSLLSTFVIATPPGEAKDWREQVMIWEAADPYLYVRTTADGRIVAGGEDVEISDARQRDALLPAKSGAIAEQVERLLRRDSLRFDHRWAATFGTSPDTLPALGAAANMPHLWLSYGYGGNGIAFAALAADLLPAALKGEPAAALAWFDPYRFEA